MKTKKKQQLKEINKIVKGSKMKIEIIMITYWKIFGNEILRNSHRQYKNKFHKKAGQWFTNRIYEIKGFQALKIQQKNCISQAKKNVKSKNVQTENIP